MRPSTAEPSPSHRLPSLPLMLEQTASPALPLVLIAVLLPAAVLLPVPFALVIEQIADDPAARAVIAERPVAAIQLILAAAVLAYALWWPLLSAARSLMSARTITIDGRSVTVTERGPFGQRTWSEPLAAYAGLTHRVRASISGLRHELLLVHADCARSVLIGVADRISHEEAERFANLLAVAEIPSREAHRLSQLRAVLGPAEPQPRLGVART